MGLMSEEMRAFNGGMGPSPMPLLIPPSATSTESQADSIMMLAVKQQRAIRAGSGPSPAPLPIPPSTTSTETKGW